MANARRHTTFKHIVFFLQFEELLQRHLLTGFLTTGVPLVLQQTQMRLSPD